MGERKKGKRIILIRRGRDDLRREVAYVKLLPRGTKGYPTCLKIHATHVTANNSANINVLVLIFQIWREEIITINNHQSKSLGQRRKQYFVSLLIWQQNNSKRCKQNFARRSTSTAIPREAKFVVRHKFQATGSVNDLNKKVETPTSHQQGYCKISWLNGCGERFCRKESKIVHPKTLPCGAQ